MTGIEFTDFTGNPDIEIEGLAYNSKEIRPGYLFIALKGNTLDGHNFVEEAIRKGASAVVMEKIMPIHPSISFIIVPNSRNAMSKLSAKFYRYPFEKINLTGITGTNGKTTTSYILESILQSSGAKPGVIGTINYRFPGHTIAAPITTPESLDLMQILRRMANAGVTDVVIEVSSHALQQGRVRDCPFKTAIFTNLTRDHLDYHGSMENYFQAKSRLFMGLKKRSQGDATAIINTDDPKGKELAKLVCKNVVTYGLKDTCNIKAKMIRAGRTGIIAKLVMPSGETEIHSPLIGKFNIYNILAAAAAAYSMGIDMEAIKTGISRLEHIPGRLEMVKNSQSLTIVVDYAHTPDALDKVLKALRPLVSGRIITLFGCGGDRDSGKRYEMGRVAGTLSDMVFITTDNPRTEDPYSIASQVKKGVQDVLNGSRCIVDLDRKSAIKRAVKTIDKNDLLLIAGKGHEDYQIIGKHKKNFDDRIVAMKAAAERI